MGGPLAPRDPVVGRDGKVSQNWMRYFDQLTTIFRGVFTYGALVGHPNDSSSLSTELNARENKTNKDTDPTLDANSDTKYASQKAAKRFVYEKKPLPFHGNIGAGEYVRLTKPYHAIAGLSLATADVSTTPFGLADTSVVTWGRSQNYDSEFGYQGAKSLDRIEYSFKTAASLGCKITKTVLHFARHDELSASINGASNLTLDENSGWEAIDRAVDVCRTYGMTLLLTFVPPQGADTGWGLDRDTPGASSLALTRWYIPFATFVANRYILDTDVVQLQPVNEMATRFHPDDWVNVQATIYDTIKAIAPSMTVTLSGVYHLPTVTYNSTVMGLLDRLSAAGKLSKFDNNVDVHLYPDEDIVRTYGRANIDPYVAVGEGGPQDVTAIIAKLDSLGLTGIKVRIGEFGLFWNGGDTEVKETASATDIGDMYDLYKNESRMDAVLYWVNWGREPDTTLTLISGIQGLVGQPGMGIMVDDSDQYPLPPSPFPEKSLAVFDTSGRPVEAIEEWPSGDPSHITAFSTSYGDVNRFVFRRANGTEATPTGILSGQALGNFGFRGHDGDNFSSISRATVQANATQDFTPTAQGAEMRFSTTENDTTTSVVRMLLAHDGKVGIGTLSPSQELEIVGTVKATAFEGDGSALTGIAAASGSAGEVQFSAGSGVLTSDPAFSYSGGTLTLAKSGSLANRYRIWGIGDSGFNTFSIDEDGSATFANVGTGTVDASSYKLAGVPITFTSGTVTAVSSANADISVATGTTTPVLTLNSSTTGGASLIPKYDANGGQTITATGSNMTLSRSAGTPMVVFKRSNGTSGSPTAVLSADPLGALVVSGAVAAGTYDTNRTAISITASENWSNAAGATTGGTYIVFNTRSPQTGQSTMNGMTERLRISDAGFFGISLGASVASATTITPTGPIFHITGTTAIATINIPYTGFNGQITIIPDGLFTTTTAGNIALASTAVVSKALIMTYDATAAKWYPSY